MTWTRVDDGLPDHPKIQKVSPAAAFLYVAGLCYCARVLSDGWIPDRQLPGLCHVRYPKTLARELASVVLWERGNGGWSVHDYHDFQPSAAEIKEARKRDAERKRKARLSKLGLEDPDGRPGGHPEGRPEGVPADVPRAPRPGPVNPSHPSSFNPSSVVNGAGGDEDIKRALIELASDERQERQWLALFAVDSERIAKCVLVARREAKTNVGGYLAKLIANGSTPDIDTRSPADRVYTSCLRWVNSPAFDPETMSEDSVLDEIATREKTMRGHLTVEQRLQIIDRAAELRPPADATKGA